MSSTDQPLSAGAVRLVLAALETPQAQLSPAAMRHRRADAIRLCKAGIIKPAGYEPVTTASDDFSDNPVSLTWNEDGGNFRYFSEVSGWCEVAHDQVARYAIDFLRLTASLMEKCNLTGKSEEVVPSHLWQLGLVRLGTRPKRISILFGRRLHDTEVWRKVEAVLQDRPSQQRRVILTSTATHLLSGGSRGCTVIAIADVLRSSGYLSVDPGLVALRYDQVEFTHPEEPLVVSRGGAEARLLGHTFLFKRGKKQQRILAYMFERYREGKRWTSSDEIVVALDLGDKTRIRDIFKRNQAWGVLLTERDGQCGFCLPEAK